MKTFHGLGTQPLPLRRPKVALGTFDGVHLGHKRVLRDLVAWARATDCDAAALTFDWKPRFVLGSGPRMQITSLSHRLVLLERLGLDAAVVLAFDERLASMQPEEFVGEVLVRGLGASGVLLGHDTRFGRNARGDFDLMSRLGRRFGFEACAVEVVEVDGAPVSSTRVRQAIQAGDLTLAERLLGRRVSVLGTVVPGTNRGRRLGFPTANLDLHHDVRPPDGVYATRALVDGAWRDSVTSIGRPQGGPPHAGDGPPVETHILDFSGALYGRELEVRFVGRLRDQRRFDSDAALTEQIARDIQIARSRLAAVSELDEAPV